MSETWYVPVADISPDPHNPRKSFNSEDLYNLAQSIKTYGLVQPIVLREAVDEDRKEGVKTKYVLVAGERRWRACGMINWEEIPAVMLAEVSVGKKNTKASLAARREIPVQATAELALVENIQRQNLTPIEEARAFDTMLKTEANLSAASLAQRLGLTAEYIRLRLRLLELPEDTQGLIGNNKLPLQHANILHALVGNAPDAKINAAATDAARKRLPAKTLERVVRGMLDKSPRKKYTREEQAASAPAPAPAPAPQVEAVRSQMFAADLPVAAPTAAAPAAAAAPKQSDVTWKYLPSDFLPPIGHLPVQRAATKTKDGHRGFVFAARDPELVQRCWEAIADIIEPPQDEEELDV
jgi:ParB family chromosome partitioning protein